MVLPKLQAQIRGPILELYFPVELFRVVILNPLTIIKYFLWKSMEFAVNGCDLSCKYMLWRRENNSFVLFLEICL